MPITKSAKKALRSSARKRAFNSKRKNQAKDVLKEIKKLISEGKKSEAEKMLPVAYQILDKSAKTGLIKKNTAARKKSRLMASISKIK